LDRVADGEEAHYESVNGAENDLEQAATWGPERTIHTEVLRWLCVDRDAICHIDPRGLSIHGAKIDGTVFLDQGFQAEGEVRMVNATIGGDLDCEGGAFHQAGGIALEASGAKIDGSVLLRQGFQAEGFVHFDGTRIQGYLDCNGASFSGAAPNGESV